MGNSPNDNRSTFNQTKYLHLAGYGLYQLPTEIAQQQGVNISSFVRRVGDKISQGDGMVMGVQNLYYGALAGVFDSSAVAWPYQMVNSFQNSQQIFADQNHCQDRLYNNLIFAITF